MPELPPRARRIPTGTSRWVRVFGTTSACAENTSARSRSPSAPWNYLRVRGEYRQIIAATASMWELPPRARRIRHNPICVVHKFGTTSACAENTASACGSRGQPGNYLRVRGEYRFIGGVGGFFGELPPRARRIRLAEGSDQMRPGTTSACAENTPDSGSSGLARRNYLRVRGEYDCAHLGFSSLEELPPRARRILTVDALRTIKEGTTSACAENTPRFRHCYV